MKYMYTYIRTYICTCIHTYKHTHTYIHVHRHRSRPRAKTALEATSSWRSCLEAARRRELSSSSSRARSAFSRARSRVPGLSNMKRRRNAKNNKGIIMITNHNHKRAVSKRISGLSFLRAGGGDSGLQVSPILNLSSTPETLVFPALACPTVMVRT